MGNCDDDLPIEIDGKRANVMHQQIVITEENLEGSNMIYQCNKLCK